MERLDKMFSEDLLNKVKEILDEGKKQVDEAVEVSHTRYLRSHGKKASGRGPWMFTHKLYGDAKGDDTFAAPSSAKSFSDATKHAKEWAKSKGHRTVYVMEEVEHIDEAAFDAACNEKLDDINESYSHLSTAELRQHAENAIKSGDKQKVRELTQEIKSRIEKKTGKSYVKPDKYSEKTVKDYERITGKKFPTRTVRKI